MKKINNKNTGKKSEALSSKTKQGKEEKEKLAHTRERVINFFVSYGAEEASRELWVILRLALTNKQEEVDAIKTDDMIFFYEMSKELFENIEMVWENEIMKYKVLLKELGLLYPDLFQRIKK